MGSKRISMSLFDEELKGLINASAKIFPITQLQVDSNLNPDNYEYGRIERSIYRWHEGTWSYIVADDIDIEWSTIKNKPSTFPPIEHTHPTLIGETGATGAMGVVIQPNEPSTNDVIWVDTDDDGLVSDVENELNQHKLNYTTQVKFPVTNLIANGDFSDGTTGWTVVNNTVLTSNLGICTATFGITKIRFGRMLKSVIDVNKYVYVFFKARANKSGIARIQLMQNSIASGESFRFDVTLGVEWSNYSTVKKAGEIISNKGVYFGLDGSGFAAAGDYIDIQNALIVDLTATFGVGNEPTKQEMDLLITLLGGWFDGTITPTQKQLANWYLKMIRQNRNAIIALGGTIV